MNNVRIQMASSESTTFTVLGLLHQLGYRAALIVVCCKSEGNYFPERFLHFDIPNFFKLSCVKST